MGAEAGAAVLKRVTAESGLKLNAFQGLVTRSDAEPRSASPRGVIALGI